MSCHFILMLHSRGSRTEHPVDPRYVGVRGTQCLLLILSKQGVDSLRGNAFHFNQNFLRMQKESIDILRNTNDHGTLFFLTHITSLY